MKVALDALVEAGYEKAVLWTPARHEPAHAFFERMGWRPTGADRAEGRHVAFEIGLRRRLRGAQDRGPQGADDRGPRGAHN